MAFSNISRRRILQLAGGALAAGAMSRLTGTAVGQDAATVKLWDQFSRDPQQSTFQALLDDYVAQGGARIERTIQPGDTIGQIAGTALASGTGPDVIQYSVGKGNAGVLASAGLILPLDDYAEKFGWKTSLSPIAQLEAQLDGKLYGAPQESEVTAIFVNKTLFDQHGFKVPTTHEEAVEFAKAAAPTGIVPMAYGELDIFPSWWAFSHVVSNAIGSKAAGDLVFNNVGSFNTPEIVDGIESFWGEFKAAGGFIPQVNSLGAADAQALFLAGGAFLLINGTWAAAELETTMVGMELDIMPFWSLGGKPRAYPTGSGSALYISSAAQDKDAAADFINFLYGKSATNPMAEKAGIYSPAPIDIDALTLSDFQKRSVNSVNNGDGDPSVNQGVFVNHGLAGSEFLRTMTSGFQAMHSGQKTAAQQAADLQAAWEKDNG